MKRKLYTLAIGLSGMFSSITMQGQTTATPYDFIDCNGNNQSIFGELDAGKALILEFFMTSCSPCITAGNALEAMKADLLAEFPGMVKAYDFGFSDSYTCSAINSWVTTNGFTAVPCDSGAYQVAYYGGMGMPTIVILGGGTNHSVLGAPYVGFTNSDTATMANDIRNFLNPSGVKDISEVVSNVNIFPNPAFDVLNVSFTAKKPVDIAIDLYDVQGKWITKLYQSSQSFGAIDVPVNTAELAPGSYVVKINAGGAVTNHKLNIVR